MKRKKKIYRILIMGLVFLLGAAVMAAPINALSGAIDPETATKEELKELWDPANYVYTGDIRHLDLESYRQKIHSYIDYGMKYFKYYRVLVTNHYEDNLDEPEDYWILVVVGFTSKYHNFYYEVRENSNRLYAKVDDGEFVMIHPVRKNIPFQPIGYYTDKIESYPRYANTSTELGATQLYYLKSIDTKLIEIPNEYVSPSPPNVTSIKVVDVGPDYASLEWAAVPGVDGYRVEFWEGANEEGMNYIDVRSTNVKLMNLKPSTFYRVRIKSIRNGVVSDRSSAANFRTLDYTKYVKVYHGEDLIVLNTQTSVHEYKHIIIETKGYEFIDVKVNETLIYSSQAAAQNVINPEMYTDWGESGQYNFRVEARDSSGKIDIYQFTLFNPGEYDGYPDPGGLRPSPPEKPEKSWDIVGWIQYIWEWLIYIVETVVYFINQAGTMITRVFSETSGLVRVLRDFFSFLPGNLVTLIGIGISLAILLRIFKR